MALHKLTDGKKEIEVSTLQLKHMKKDGALYDGKWKEVTNEVPPEVAQALLERFRKPVGNPAPPTPPATEPEPENLDDDQPGEVQQIEPSQTAEPDPATVEKALHADLPPLTRRGGRPKKVRQ